MGSDERPGAPIVVQRYLTIVSACEKSAIHWPRPLHFCNLTWLTVLSVHWWTSRMSLLVLVAAHAAPIDIFAHSDGANTHIADVRLGPGATTVGHPQRVNDLVDADSFRSKTEELRVRITSPLMLQ